METYEDIGLRLRESFLQFAEYIPALVGALVILLAGYLLAKLVERGIDRALAKLGLNRWLARGGVLEAVERTGWQRKPSRLVANIVFWFLMFGVIILAANAVGLTGLTAVFQELVSYIPNVIAAVVIILVGVVLGEFVEGLIRASTGGIQGGPTLARVGRSGVILLAVFMSLQELGVASEIVVTAFGILFGAIALAMALAFGLGNRELAGEVTREWYARLRAEREAIAHHAEMRHQREAGEEAVEDVGEDVGEGEEDPRALG